MRLKPSALSDLVEKHVKKKPLGKAGRKAARQAVLSALKESRHS